MNTLNRRFLSSKMNTEDHPDVWHKEIERLLRRKKKLSSQENLIVFYGSSSIRLWVHLKSDLNPYNVLNLGFGGSTFAWCNYYFDTLFEDIIPKEIILYGGDNDLSNHSIELAVQDLELLLSKIKRKYGNIKTALISVKPSPARGYLEPQIVKFNTLLRNKVESIEDGHFINIHSLMLDENGEARKELFLPDQLHMNRNGYIIWRDAVLNHLKKKTF